MNKKGFQILGKDGKFSVRKDCQTVFQGKIENNLFTIAPPLKSPSPRHNENILLLSLANSKELLKKIHETYTCASLPRLTFALKSIDKEAINSFKCKSSVASKITKEPFKVTASRASKVLQRLHMDLIGPIDPISWSGHKYILTIVDNFSGYLTGIPFKSKDKTAEVIIKLLSHEKARRGRLPEMVCSDGGREFTSTKLRKFPVENHIQQVLSEPYHSEHNGRAKRANRTVTGAVRETLIGSGLQKKYWSASMKGTCLCLNQIPREGQSKSTWSLFHGRPLPEGYLQPIGSPSVFLNKIRIKGRKFDEKGLDGTLVGFNSTLLSYVLLTKSGKFFEKKHVKFLKSPPAAEYDHLSSNLEFIPQTSEEKSENLKSENPVDSSLETESHAEN